MIDFFISYESCIGSSIRAYANATRDSSDHVGRHWNGNFMVYKTEIDRVEIEEQVSHVIKMYLRSLRRPLKGVRGLYIYMK
jgi:hypothetical protein